MRYRKLDANGDMVFGNQQADFYRDQPEAVAQAVLTRLKLWTGEWFLDTTEGTPWQQAVLGTNNARTIEPVIRARILGTQGVNEIIDFSLAFDPDTRTATMSAEIDTVYGQTTLEGVI